MAWGSSTGTVAAASNQVSGTSFTTGAITCPQNDTIFLGFVFDNTSSTAPTITSITVPAGETASWQCIARVNSSTSTSGSGTKEELWAITVANSGGWSAFSPVATLSGAVTAKVSAGFCKSGGSTNVRTDISTTPMAGSTSSTSAPSNANTRPLSGDLVVGLAGFQTATLPTGDSDTTNGSWSSAVTSVTSLGTDNLNVVLIMQNKIVTASGTQTYNPTDTVSTASGAVCAEFAPAGATTAEVSRVHVEALVRATPVAEISRVHVEALVQATPMAEISRVHVEALVKVGNTISGEWLP